MNRTVLSGALCLVVSCASISCRTSYNPSTVPVDGWFSQKNSRSPRVSKAREAIYSGRVSQTILAEANGSNTRIIIDVYSQKGYLLVGERVAASCPVSTAKPGKHTPLGTFSLTERIRSGKISTIYNVDMPYWMRLDELPIGLHAGYVPGYPASAGCIRLPYDMARLFYDHTQNGTPVTICNQWSGI